jgi:hypothetical protein
VHPGHVLCILVTRFVVCQEVLSEPDGIRQGGWRARHVGEREKGKEGSGKRELVGDRQRELPARSLASTRLRSTAGSPYSTWPSVGEVR